MTEVLIAPNGIETVQDITLRGWRTIVLIAPNGIETKKKINQVKELAVLIAPNGIETPFSSYMMLATEGINRTQWN